MADPKKSNHLEKLALAISVLSAFIGGKAYYDAKVVSEKINKNFHSFLLSEVKDNNNKSIVFTSQNPKLFPKNANEELSCTRQSSINDSDADSVSLASNGFSNFTINFDLSEMGLLSAQEVELLKKYRTDLNNLQQSVFKLSSAKQQENKNTSKTTLLYNFCEFAKTSQTTFNEIK
ncbi:hypothetical protein DH20_22355 [Pantoea agglomerans]|nr:hypothetical protein [Pantoea agglomerans]